MNSANVGKALQRALSVSEVHTIRQRAVEFAVEAEVLGIYSGKEVNPI